MSYRTDHRLFSLHTVLQHDTLLIFRMQGEEGLSRLYRFELELASEQADIDALSLIGKPVRLDMQADDGERQWSGYVASFTRAGQSDRQQQQDSPLTFYRMEVVPWLWFTQHHEDSRIFQQRAIPDIVEQLFEEFGYSDFEWKLQADYAPLVYCTQYRESHFQFISRLLEQAGIYWYFRQDRTGAVLVLTDHADSHRALDDHGGLLRYHDHDMSADTDTITSLTRRQALRTGRIALNDYHFERPGLDLNLSLDSLVRAGDNAHYERYLHPGGYIERDEGDRIARILLEAEEAQHETLRGESHARRMSAGLTFSLQDHPQDALNQAYLITQVRHEGTNNVGGVGGQDDALSDYRNTFAALPLRVPYRCPPTTPRPRIAGPQTAIVAGPEGEEIHTDAYGRIKVHFFWDRRSRRNEKSSCWVRVAQLWAGRQWGTFFLPRIGHEVVVEFLEGDPDQPLVTGSVYNGDNLPPYALPAHATRATLKSLSTKGGDGFNEVRFEDKQGQEQVFVHAQRDLDRRVRRDTRTWTGNDAHHMVMRDRIEEVHRDQSLHIQRHRITEVDQDDALAVHGEQAIAIDGAQSLKVGGAIAVSCQSHSESVDTDYYLATGTGIVIEAGAMITLKVGGSSITLSPAGVTIDGPIVRINSGGTPGSGVAAPITPPHPVLPATAADDDKPGSHHASGPKPESLQSPAAKPVPKLEDTDDSQDPRWY